MCYPLPYILYAFAYLIFGKFWKLNTRITRRETRCWYLFINSLISSKYNLYVSLEFWLTIRYSTRWTKVILVASCWKDYVDASTEIARTKTAWIQHISFCPFLFSIIHLIVLWNSYSHHIQSDMCTIHLDVYFDS